MVDEKIIERIKKLFALGEGTNFDENLSESARQNLLNEKLAATMMARKLLSKYHLDESAIKAQAQVSHQVYVAPVFGQSTTYNPFKRKNARGLNQRRVWFEKLAEVVAEGNYCRIGLEPENGGVIFFGLEMDREVSSFVLASLGAIADNLCSYEMKRAEKVAGMMNFRTKEKSPAWKGEDIFIESFHQGFRSVIKKVFDDMNGKSEPNERDKYFESRCSYHQKSENVWANDETIVIEEYYVAIGQKIGERAVEKLSLDEGSAKVTSMIVNAQQVKAEKAEVERKLLYAFLGIDESLPIEAFLAIDSSSSMSGEGKMNQAKEGAISYARDANQKGNKVGIVTFGAPNGDEKLIIPTEMIGEDFYQFIQQLNPYGSTPMHRAIEKANDYFKESKARRYLIVITDGQPDSQDAALIAAKSAKDNGVIIQCIGTHDAPKEFMDKLASNGKSLSIGNNALGEGIKRMAGLLGA